MRFLLAFFTLSACGVWAANVDDVEADSVDTGTAAEEVKNSSEENWRENSLARSHTFTAPDSAEDDTPTPIRALILPNNVCVINRDLAPDRSIEEHILACVKAQRIRNTIAR